MKSFWRKRGLVLALWVSLLVIHGVVGNRIQAAVELQLHTSQPIRFAATTDDGLPHYLRWQGAINLTEPVWQDFSAQVLQAGIGYYTVQPTNRTLFLRTAIAAPPSRRTNVWDESLGNHRAVVEVSQSAQAVYTLLPWRQPVKNPAEMELLVYDARSGLQVTNALRLHGTGEFGQIVFQPISGPGEYFIYYLPVRQTGPWWLPRTEYAAFTNRAEAAWLAEMTPALIALTNSLPTSIPEAHVKYWEALNQFHQFTKMEITASPKETSNLLYRAEGLPFLVFPESRQNPIRMTGKIPQHWAILWPSNSTLSLTGRPNEFLTFQLGVFAFRQPLSHVHVEGQSWRHVSNGNVMDVPLRCFNMGGTNSSGQSFSNAVFVPQGKVQALWLGLDLPNHAPSGVYTSSVVVSAVGLSSVVVPLQLTILPDAASDRGDDNPAMLSRLRWLDSTLGISYDTIAPYPPIILSNRTVHVLGRTLTVGNNGLPESIQCYFSPSNDRLVSEGVELLAEPIEWRVETQGISRTYTNQSLSFTMLGTGALQWVATNVGNGFQFSVHAVMESDGHLDLVTRFEPTSNNGLLLSNLSLRIALDGRIATHFMGMGRKGGLRPMQHRWQWSAFANNYFWAGKPNAGLYLKLKHKQPRWDMSWLPLYYKDWYQGTNSVCTFTEENDGRFAAEVQTGPFLLSDTREFHFSLIPTPFKPLPPEHFQWRYYHADRAPDLSTVTQAGANIINIHQDLILNPYLNYPFFNTNELSQYINAAHQNGVKVKLYYTVRELSVHAHEFWALRSLGTEIFQSGNPTKNGWSWLHEHLDPGFVPTWHQPLANGTWDAALATQGVSRWHNYYIEGIQWLVRHVNLDGLYLDGLGYDRSITKRMRRVLNSIKPGCLLDLHSGNGFDPIYGNITTACLYMEHFPYLDSIWFGEYFDYDGEGPDYWLIEISGIPFGLYGEMLGSQTNPWRGMVFGLSNRLGWGGDPRHLWRLWDDFRIGESRLVGWWDPALPVHSSDPQIKVSCFVREGATLIALASWAAETRNITLSFNWEQLGLNPASVNLEIPEIQNYQGARILSPTDTIQVEPGRGFLIWAH